MWCYRCLGFTPYPLPKFRDISEMPFSIQLLKAKPSRLGRLGSHALLVAKSPCNAALAHLLRQQHGGSSTSSENGATQLLQEIQRQKKTQGTKTATSLQQGYDHEHSFSTEQPPDAQSLGDINEKRGIIAKIKNNNYRISVIETFFKKVKHLL